MRELLCEIRVAAECRTLRVYTDGEIDGFGPEAMVINRYPTLLAMAVERARQSSGPNGTCLPLKLTTSIESPDRLGGEHSTAA
jgi:hypothetical protein